MFLWFSIHQLAVLADVPRNEPSIRHTSSIHHFFARKMVLKIMRHLPCGYPLRLTSRKLTIKFLGSNQKITYPFCDYSFTLILRYFFSAVALLCLLKKALSQRKISKPKLGDYLLNTPLRDVTDVVQR
jgi:hypothetical protein